MNPIANAVLSTGLVDPQVLAELRRWGGVPFEPPAPEPLPRSAEEVAVRIRGALESEGYVLVRETDLAAVDQYTSSMMPGILHLVLDVDAEMQDADVPITFGRTPLGEYIIPWRSAGIQDVLANGMTYLVEGPQRVFFREVRELFFGETKAFMICTPGGTEPLPALVAGPDEDTDHVEHH